MTEKKTKESTPVIIIPPSGPSLCLLSSRGREEQISPPPWCYLRPEAVLRVLLAMVLGRGVGGATYGGERDGATFLLDVIHSHRASLQNGRGA